MAGPSETSDFFFFLLSKKAQHTVDNKVSTLARLILYENLFIEQEKNVRCPHKQVEFRQNARAFFPGDKENCP